MKRFALTLLFGLLWATSSASAATFELCVKTDVWVLDNGSVNGISPDHWNGSANLDGYIVTGRGYRVKLYQGTWSQNFDADPITGCFSFDRASASGFKVRIYGYSTNKNGAVVRVHDMGLETEDWYPGSSLSQYWTNQTLSSSEPNVYVLDGRADDRFTTMASAAFSLMRFHEGNHDATISIGFAEGDCNSSGSIHGMAEHHIEEHRAHLLRVGRCPGFGSDARERMVASHEMGHAWMRMHYGKDGDDNPRNDDYNPPAQPLSPPSGTDCVNVGSYDMTSIEWNSQAFKESIADFYAARVWNNRDYRGTYIYRGRAYDLETWDVWQGTHQSGGFVGNICGYGAVAGVSTKGDYLRFLWDWYTTHSCANQPKRYDVMNLYKAVHDNKSAAFPLTNSNYDAAMVYAIENSVPGLSQCERDIAQPYGDYNGI